MSWTLSPEGLNLLLAGLHEAQLALRALWHALGLAPDRHGQPVWPFPWRVAGEMLALDAGHVRNVVGTLACLAVALLCAVLALFWRRRRQALLLVALLPLLLAPWPAARLLFKPALPTSFHQNAAGFTAQGIVRGQRLYAQHCLRCHGADGGGEGPDAARGPMWPPTLTGALLWKRLDGELFWHVRHGMQGREGVPTMPGFAAELRDDQIWEVLDFLQANAAGRTLQATGRWDYPVPMPELVLQCRSGRARTVRALQGQRLQVTVAGPRQALPAEDPRLVSVVLAQPGSAPVDGSPECQMTDPAAGPALALLLGVEPQGLGGYQLLADRDGWLRARGQPGQAAWSADDLVCRSAAAPVDQRAAAPKAADGLDGLIRRMDAEPVRLLRGGFPH